MKGRFLFLKLLPVSSIPSTPRSDPVKTTYKIWGSVLQPRTPAGIRRSPGRSCILLQCMLAKRTVCNISGSLVSTAMSGKMKANLGSGRIWNLIMGVFRGGLLGAPSPNRSSNFCSEYILWHEQWTLDSDCSRTAPGHCCGSTQQLLQRQVSKRLPTAGHPRNTAHNDVRV